MQTIAITISCKDTTTVVNIAADLGELLGETTLGYIMTGCIFCATVSRARWASEIATNVYYWLEQNENILAVSTLCT